MIGENYNEKTQKLKVKMQELMLAEYKYIDSPSYFKATWNTPIRLRMIRKNLASRMRYKFYANGALLKQTVKQDA